VDKCGQGISPIARDVRYAPLSATLRTHYATLSTTLRTHYATQFMLYAQLMQSYHSHCLYCCYCIYVPCLPLSYLYQ